MALDYTKKYDYDPVCNAEGNITKVIQKCDTEKIDMIAAYVEYPNVSLCNESGRESSETGIELTDVPFYSFLICSKPVTIALWNAVMPEANRMKGNNAHPVLATEEEIQLFVKTLNEKTELNYRLPTVKEWQFAAKGGLKSKGFMYCGSNKCDDVACYKKSSAGSLGQVATHRRNELGLYDMSGNVWELCNKESEEETSENHTPIESSYQICGGDYRSPEQECLPDSSRNLRCRKIKKFCFWYIGDPKWVFTYKGEKWWPWRWIAAIFKKSSKKLFEKKFGFRLAVTLYPEDIERMTK